MWGGLGIRFLRLAGSLMRIFKMCAVRNRAYRGEDARLETAPTGKAGDRPPRYGRMGDLDNVKPDEKKKRRKKR